MCFRLLSRIFIFGFRCLGYFRGFYENKNHGFFIHLESRLLIMICFEGVKCLGEILEREALIWIELNGLDRSHSTQTLKKIKKENSSGGRNLYENLHEALSVFRSKDYQWLLWLS